MAANSTQPSHTPLELSVINIEDDFDIHPLLPADITAASQPSFIPFNQADMISSDSIADSRVRNNDAQGDGLTTGQQILPTYDTEAFDRRQREQRRRLNQEQRRIDQERQSLNGERRRERRRRQQERQIQFEQRRRERNEQPQDNLVRHRSAPRCNDPHFYEMMNRDTLEHPIDDMFNELLLEAYNYETMDPEARQKAWEQDHLKEMQGLSEPQHFAAQPNGLERYALEQDSILQRDQHEQVLKIYDMQNENHFQRCQRNDEQLTDKEEWEDIAFRLQQQQ